MDKKIDAQAFETFTKKVFKLTDEEMASLYNEAGELTNFSLIETKDAERLKKFTGDKTSQYNRGLKEGAEKLEKSLKEKYEVESDLIGDELFDFIVETKVADIKKGEGDILKHPEVIKLQNSWLREKKVIDKDWQKKLDDKEREVNESNLFKDVESAGLAEYESLNPILPEDPKKAKALKDIVISEMKKSKYQKEGESYSVLGADGAVLKDEHGYPVTFNSHIKGIAEKYFDFKQAIDRSSSGNKGSDGKTSQKIRTPKNMDDYVEMMKDNTLTPKERVEIKNLAINAKVIK